ncbi:MAG: RNB domain-containing ribonuclease [Candidatus Acidiferrum sp.]
MPRPSHLNPDDILRFLQVSANPPAASDISRALHLKKSDQHSLFKLLDKLKKRGAIDELPGGRYRLTSRKNDHRSDQDASRQAARDVAHHRDTLARDEVRGRLVLHHDGYGFVVPDHPIPELDGDIFIPRLAIDDAMHGDHVLAKFQRRSGQSDRQRAEGRIIKILDRAHPNVVGLFRYGPRYNVVLPYDARLQHEIEIPAGEELTPALREKLIAHDPAFDPKNPHARTKRIPRLEELDGAVVNIEITRYPRAGTTPIGRVMEILGRPGELGVDVEIIIRKHHLPYEFPRAVLTEAEHRAQLPSEAELAAREDFRHLPIVTIDGETARDFDDAVYVEKRPDNSWHLQVHIADVSHYVRNGTALDQEARLRGTSVYFPDRAVPMLPESLSNGICSLKPREDRLVMSALIELDPYGNIQTSRLTSGVIKSAARMTYTKVNKILENDPEVSAQYAPHVENFRRMKELALLLNARRAEHGSIDFDLPERVIAFDDQQRMTSINRSERNIANRLIEEFMLTANRVVDAYLLHRAIPALHRVHEKPDARKVLEFEELARAFGYSLNVEDLHRKEITVRHGANPAAKSAGRKGGRDSRGQRGRDGKGRGGRGADQMKVSLAGAELAITPQHYQRLVRKITGTPEERILSYLMLRSLKQARYAADPLGHFALGFDEYTHVTSPIRRYPDLIIHRILKWALENPEAKSERPFLGARSIVPASDHRHPASVDSTRHDSAHESRHAPIQHLSAQSIPEKSASAPPQAQTEAIRYSELQLREIATETSEAERRAAAAERELLDWKTAQFMEQHLGEEYEGLIISVQKFGVFVELSEVFVEGLLPLAALEDAAGTRCIYREFDHSIVALPGGSTMVYADPPKDRHKSRRKDQSSQPHTGRGAKPQPQRAWHLGDPVHVRAERIDPIRKRVEFALVE